MGKAYTITRRSVLVGALAGALALPALASATPMLPALSSVREAIAAHKAARRALLRIDRTVDRLEALPNRPPLPKVQHATYLKRSGEDESPIRTPMFAYSHRELDQLLEQRLASARHLFGEKTLDQIRETYAGMHRELTAMTRRRKAFDRQSGLSDAYQVQAAALDREVDAAAKLILTAPTSHAEATLKRRYVQRLGGAEWWMCQSHRDRIMLLCRQPLTAN